MCHGQLNHNLGLKSVNYEDKLLYKAPRKVVNQVVWKR